MFLQENCVYETVVLPLDEETFEKTVTPIVQEYFEHGDANEVAVRFMTVLLNEETAFALSYLIGVMQSCVIIFMSKQTWGMEYSLYNQNISLFLQELLAELNLGGMRGDVPMLAISLALEAKASHRELTSRLLSELCGHVLTAGDVEASFHKLLKELPDLVLDTPGAPQVTH